MVNDPNTSKNQVFFKNFILKMLLEYIIDFKANMVCPQYFSYGRAANRLHEYIL